MPEHGETQQIEADTGAASVRIDWDLLQPTLTASDDATGFARPWNPWIVLVLVVICKAMIGTLLLAWNAWRLGLRRQAVPLALAGPLATCVVIAGFCWWWLAGDSKSSVEEIKESVRILRFMLSGASACVCLLVMKSHHRRYRLAVVSGVKEGSLWVAGAVFVLASMFFVNVRVEPWLIGVIGQLFGH